MDFSQKTKEELLLEIESLQKENANLKIQENKYAFSNPFLQAIVKINSLMVINNTLEDAMNEICKVLVEDGNFAMAWIGIINQDTKQLEPKAIYGDKFDYISKIKVYSDERPEGMGPCGIAIRENKPSIVQDALHDNRMKPWFEERSKTTWNSLIAVPLKIGTEIIGVLSVYANEVNYFTDVEIEILESAAKSFQNFADRLKIKNELIENETRYSKLVENLEAGIVIHAPNTQIIKFNKKSSELLGLTIEQMEGKLAIDPAWKFLNEDGSDMTYENYPVNLVLKNKKPFHNLILGINQPKNTEVVWVDVNGTPIFNTKQELTEILISFFDVTEKVNSEKELRKQDKYLNEIQRLTKIGNYETKFEDNSWECSDTVYEILGIDKKFPKK